MAKKSELSIVDRAEKLAKHVTKDDKGNIILDDAGLEEFFSDGGLTLDQVKKVQKEEAALIPTMTRVGGDTAVTIKQEHPELTEATMNFKVGMDQHIYSYNLEKGSVHHDIEVHGTATTKGETKKAITYVQGLFDAVTEDA